ncbi:MAG: DNA-binding transcriptional regulator GbsR (MarR family) [Kiritimatiellia bacterium]|jgi:DNA-binding transcriptional regulator GbsR (MarR family)
MSTEPPDRRHLAVAIIAETMGELVEFWGFKASMGRIWATLYLSRDPLPADEIARRTGLSSGAVSMSMHDLAGWGLIERVPVPGSRRRHYAAHTDVWEVIRRIFRERELRLVQTAIDRFERALELLEAEAKANPDDHELPFIIERVQGLLRLAKIGHSLVARLADVGSFTLQPIRGTLSRIMGLNR